MSGRCADELRWAREAPGHAGLSVKRQLTLSRKDMWMCTHVWEVVGAQVQETFPHSSVSLLLPALGAVRATS